MPLTKQAAGRKRSVAANQTIKLLDHSQDHFWA